MAMQYMHLAHHVHGAEVWRSGFSPGLCKRAVLQRPYSMKAICSESTLNLAAARWSTQAGCESRMVVSGRSERPRFVALAQLETVELEPVPVNEDTTKTWQDWIAFATSLYPVYMLLGGVIALWKPSAFSWFVKRGPDSYSAALGVIMLSMGFTLELKDLIRIFTKRPVAVLFGFVAQYTIMPLVGAALSRGLGLPAELSAGLILIACCPGGTASNVVCPYPGNSR